MKSGSNWWVQSVLAVLLAGGALSLGCGVPDSKEDLNPEGPPMVRQVFMTEKSENNTFKEGSLAFGSHASITNDDGVVLTAATSAAQEIRIVVDELLRGNTLEEIACADGSFARIPDGTTPDDIKACAGAAEQIAETCEKVCLSADGTPIGIRDENGDSAPDELRMIDFADACASTPIGQSHAHTNDLLAVDLGVTLTCGGVRIPFDPADSFWSPSGNQTFPSNDALGFRGLGPVVVLSAQDGAGLRSGSECQLAFHPDVVDYDDNQVCAPANGDITGACNPGDTALLTFSTEPLLLGVTAPSDGQMNVALSTGQAIILAFTGNISQESVDGLRLTAAGANVDITATVQTDKTTVLVSTGADLLPDTEYVMTVPTTVTDVFGGPLANESVITWTTVAAPPEA